MQVHMCTSVFVSVCCTHVTGWWGLCGTARGGVRGSQAGTSSQLPRRASRQGNWQEGTERGLGFRGTAGQGDGNRGEGTARGRVRWREGTVGVRRGASRERAEAGSWKWAWSPGRGEASWARAADAWPVSRASQPSAMSPHARHLGEPDEAELLGQEGVVAEAHGGPDGLVDGAVAEVHLRRDELQVRGGDYGVDRELHRFDLKCRGPAHSWSQAASPQTRPAVRTAEHCRGPWVRPFTDTHLP